MEEIDGLEVDLDRLPADLRELAPFIRRWAVGDDEERDTRIELAATEDLAELWLAVSPHFPAINAYLEGSAEADAPSEAVVLAATAGAAIEAGGLIERRTGAPPPAASA